MKIMKIFDHPEYLFEAFCATPSIILDTIVQGAHKIIVEEKDLITNGEFDPEVLEIEAQMHLTS